MKQSLLALLMTAGVWATPGILVMEARAQRVTELTPAISAQNTSPDTSISGQFDAGTGPAVDAGSVRITVNDRDVTNRSTITRNFFSYRPDQPFSPGPVQVQVRYRNVNGEERTANWSFTVQQLQPLQIISVTHNAIASQTTPSNLTVTINGTPGAQASVLLIQDGRTVRDAVAQEVSSGVYVGTIALQRGDRMDEGIVVGRLRRQTQTTYAAAPQAVVIAGAGNGTGQAPQPGSGNTVTSDLKPRFTSHRDGERVRDGFALVGQTRPNANVQITVTSRVSVLGVDLGNLGSETLVEREVRANRDGEFRVEVPRPRIPIPGTQYTVRATARAGNETSESTEITLNQE